MSRPRRTGHPTAKAHNRAVHRKIAASKKGIIAAEAYLARVVREVEVVARAEKQTISKVVAEALKKLSQAKTDLEALEKLTADPEDP